MEDKILGFQFEPMSAKPTRPSYKDGSDQDEPQISYRRCSVKKGVLRSFAEFTGKHLYQSLFFNKVAGQTMAQVFSCEICENSKNIFFTEHIWVTASGTRNPA